MKKTVKKPVLDRYRGYEYKHTTDLFGNKFVLVHGFGEFNTLHDMMVYINDLKEQKEDIWEILH